LANPTPEWIDGIAGVLETLNQGVMILDDCGEIAFANKHYQQMIGYQDGAILGRKITDFFPPEDVPKLIEQIQRRRTHGSNLYEFYLPTATGEQLPVVVTSRQIEDPDGRIFAVVTATDITAQKKAEHALRQANSKLEQRHKEIEDDLLLAARVQQSLAPGKLSWGGVSVETFYQPVRTIGGDFGLVAPRPDHLSLMICDVSGHGIGSALVANRIYTETMSQIERGVPLQPMLQHLNGFVIRNLRSSVFYFTLAAARINVGTHSLEFAGAGHPPAMVVQPGEPPRLMESQSAVLGLIEDAVGEDSSGHIPVRSGDRVVIYTDGFTESFNEKNDMLGVEGLSQIVEDAAELRLSDMTQAIVDRVATYRHGPPSDDMSLVVVEIP